MFDFGIGYSELFVVAVVAIIVIGPKELPHVLRGLGKTLAKFRGMAREFQGHVDSAMREAGLDDVKKELQGIRNYASESLDVNKPAKPSAITGKDNDFDKYFGEPEKPAGNPAEKPAEHA